MPDLIDAEALHCTRLGRLAPRDTVTDTGLRSGDTITPTAGTRFTSKPSARSVPGSPQHEGVIDLVVNAGPQVGRRVSLLPGELCTRPRPHLRCGPRGSLASHRHLGVEVGSGAVKIRDLDSRNGSAVEGRLLLEELWLTPDEGSQVEVGRSVITFSTAAAPNLVVGAVRDGSTPFSRQPRLAAPYHAPRLQLQAAPPEVARVRLQVSAAAVPLVLGGACAAIFEQPALLLSMLLSPATLLWSYVSERRSGRRLFRQSAARYDRQLQTLAEDLELAQAEGERRWRASAPDAAEIIARALEMRPAVGAKPRG